MHMLFTFWIFNLLLCCVLIDCMEMRDGHNPHLSVDVVNESLKKKIFKHFHLCCLIPLTTLFQLCQGNRSVTHASLHFIIRIVK